MLQSILSITRPELQLSEQFYEFGMNTVHAHFQQRGFSFLFDHYFDFLLRLLHHLFDSRRMNASIHDQLLKRNPCDFPSDRIEGRQNHRFRRIVDNQIHTGQRFQRSDIAAFTSNNSSLHFIIGKLDNGYGGFRHMVGCASLNSRHHILSCLLIRFFLGSGLHILNHYGRFMLYFIFNNFQQVIFCLFGG